MNTEVFKEEDKVGKHEVVGLMKGTGYLHNFIKYYGVMPWEISDDYQFAYDKYGILHLYVKTSDWFSARVFLRIRKEQKSASDHMKDAMRYMWPFK